MSYTVILKEITPLKLIKSPYTLLFLLLLFVSSYFYHPILFSNESCRYYLIIAAADYHKLYVDDISTDESDDLSFNNGHYYSAKAIGVPLLGIPVYWLIRNLTPLGDTSPFFALNIYAVRLFVTSLPFSILGLVMFNLSRKMGIDRAKSLCMVLAYSLGTIALNHAMIFSGQQTAASFCFFSFAMIFSLKLITGKNKNAGVPYSLIAGLLAGIGALSDYTSMYIVLLLVIYLFSAKIPFRHKISYIIGGLPCLILLALYNFHCFGSIFSFSYSHLTNEAFMNGASEGLLGITLPKLSNIISILFSPSRGLFFIMPIFLYSVFGLLKMLKNKLFLPEAALIILIFLGYLFINGGFYGWHGGWTYGPRYLVPMLPFLALPIVFAGIHSIWFFLLFLLSAFQVMLSAFVFFHIPQEFVNPLFEVIIPFISAGFTAINFGNLIGLDDPVSFLPAIAVIVAIIFFLFRTFGQPEKKPVPIPCRVLSAGLALYIVLSLSLQSTKPENTVHCYRAHLLRIALKNNALKKGVGPLLYEDRKCGSSSN